MGEQVLIEDKNQDAIIQDFLREIDSQKPQKRGRKSSNGIALTPAQRNNAYRDRKKTSGCRAKGGRDYHRSSYDGLDKVSPTFIGLDGEGVGSAEQSDKYVLLAASDGSEVADWEHGLSTIDCFNFLFGLSKRMVGGSKTKAPRVRFLWFGMGYDINMILRDVPREVLQHLWSYKTARWTDEKSPKHYYCISWMPGKRFSLSYKERGRKNQNHEKGKRRIEGKILASFTSYDIFGFAQEGFVKSALGWGILKKEDENIPFLNKMKSLRGKFSLLASTKSGQETIRKYNRLEVDMIAGMGKKIWETHKYLGLNLGSMHGAGATASLILDKHNVSEHIKNSMPDQVKDKVLRGYFGARAQLHRQGRFKEVYSYDKHSAYPWAASQLPSLKESNWYKEKVFNPNLWGVWHVKWDCSPLGKLPQEIKHMIYPFPFRTEKGRIKWPQQGEGWYWTPEVATALRNFIGMIQVLDGDVLYLPYHYIKPFQFILGLYNERMRLKNGPIYDIAEKVIKLGLNAIYGKTAEGGHKYGSENAKVRLPKNQSYIYAGMMTSILRATMLEVAMISPRDIIGFATDCIFSRINLNLPLSEELGGWERKIGYDGLFLQPGVYIVYGENGEIISKHNRGFLSSEFDWERVVREWDDWPENGSKFYFISKRFIGLGAALANEQKWPGKWCTWQRSIRELAPLQAGQFNYPQYADTKVETMRYGLSQIVGMQCESGVSLPYSPDYEWLPGEDEYMVNTELLTQPELFD
jgi:hypothetical protein